MNRLDIEMWDLPVDWRGYLKFVLPELLLSLILLFALGINAILR